jgi:hypothetical protein
MRLPSQIISDRFSIQLNPSWQHWFDVAADQLILPGCFRFTVDVHGLCGAKPTQIWPGFMLPDTLPLLGNGYGDWICVRVDQQNGLGELIHWYHGGGDWIPVGGELVDAIVHDWVDLSRPVRKHMLRGAIESHRPNQTGGELSASLSAWLRPALAERPDAKSFEIERLLSLLKSGGYTEALELLVKNGIAVEAAICDLVEYTIQRAVPSEQGSLNMLPEEDSAKIAHWCSLVIDRRNDLGWAYSLLGWCQNMDRQKELAGKTFFAGRHASAFSDQSVRLRLHRFEKRHGKFSMAQLISLKSCLADELLQDEYLKIFLSSRDGNLVPLVQDYWLRLAKQSLELGQNEKAYNYAYNAGWDLGAASMAAYRKILETLHSAALAAGWQARAAVAKAHLDCI